MTEHVVPAKALEKLQTGTAQPQVEINQEDIEPPGLAQANGISRRGRGDK